MENNKEFSINGEKYDISGVPRNHRIVLLNGKSPKFIIKTELHLAIRENEKRYKGKGEVLTASKAARLYPEYFSRGVERVAPQEDVKILLRLCPDEYAFCMKQKENMTEFIRSLIKKEMDSK